MTYVSQRTNVVTFSTNLTTACLYKIHVHYFSPADGQLTIPCLNCYLQVQPTFEDYQRLEFLDMRDVLISLNNKLPLYVGKHDRNPKLIMTFRDKYDNILPVNKTILRFNYSFDIVPLTTEVV